jgi:hypothetical protein
VIQGSSSVQGGSVWLACGENSALPIIWPHGYKARFDPVELLNEHGEIVAREGDTVTMRGGLRPPGQSTDDLDNAIPGLDNAFVVQGPIERVEP